MAQNSRALVLIRYGSQLHLFNVRKNFRCFFILREVIMKKNKLRVYKFLLIVLILLIATTGTILVYRYIDRQIIQKEMNIVNNEIIKHEKPTDEEEAAIYISRLKDEYNNDDVVGVIRIDGLDIYQPLLQGSNNDYYLYHLINGKRGLSTVFVDYRTNLNSSKQINIYGHNSNYYDLPFKKLTNYLNKSFYEDNKYIEILTEEKITKYEIFSVAKVKGEYEHEKLSFKNNEAWNEHFQILKSNSIYETNVSITGEDEILILQTCLQGSQKGYLLVISARKVEGE